MTDTFTPARVKAAVDIFNDTLRDTPLRRDECVFLVAGDSPRRMLRPELVIELRDDGLTGLARRVEKHPIPPVVPS